MINSTTYAIVAATFDDTGSEISVLLNEIKLLYFVIIKENLISGRCWQYISPMTKILTKMQFI